MVSALITTALALSMLESPMLVGGNPYEDRPPEWLVRVDGEVGPCSAFLIAPAWIVTAAHCDKATETAQVGIAYREEEVTTHTVVEWAPYPDWGDCYLCRKHDLALARISPPAWGVQTLGIATKPPTIGQWEGLVGGWGTYEFAVDNIDVDAPRWKEVGEIVECEHFMDTTAICLTLEDASVCHGDSGSPLLGSDGLAYGIASRGDGACGLGSHTIYTDLTREDHREWIRKTIAGGIKANFEWPGLDPEGISIAGGWAFSPEIGIKPLVELWIDGEYAISMPCCSDRGDVPAVFPDAPILSGFAGIFNWLGLLPPGPHSLWAIIDDHQGNRKVLEKNISIQE